MSNEPNDYLDNLELFSSLPEEDKKILSTSLVVKTFEPQTDICSQGDVATSCYIILEGLVRVLLVPDHTNDVPVDSEQLIATLDQNEFFGEVALLQGGTRSATCRSGPKGVTVAVLGREEFDHILQSKNTFAYRLLDVISAQLAKYTLTSIDSLGELID